MNKIFTIVAIVLVSTVAITDKQIIQQGLNGAFEQNKLADPTTIVPCFDDATAHKVVVFVGQVLDKAAKGSISDLLSLKTLFEDFGKQIPESVKTCLADNAEIRALGAKYGIDDKTDTSALEKKVISYVTLHYLQVHKWLGNLSDEWKAGKYYQVGFDGATYGHSIIGVHAEEELAPEASDKEIIQQGLNGAFEQNKLADPTTIVPCFDDATAHKVVVFVGQVLEKAAKGSISDLLSLKTLFEDFGKQIPESVKTCLADNAEIRALGAKYGIDDKTDTSALEKKVISYVTLHYLQVHKWLGNLNDGWKAGKYYQVGFDGATYGHSIIGVHAEEELAPEASDKEIIQQGLNGAFEQNKLADPTTIVPCFDDATAHKVVVFVGQVLEKAAKGSISDLLSLKTLFEDFGKQIPESVKTCLADNAEIRALGVKYGIDDKTDTSALEKKVISYVTLHYLQVHKWLGNLNDEWKATKFYQVGFDGATYGHSIIGFSVDELKKYLRTY